MSRSDQLACTSQSEVDVIADVVFANDLLEVVALQHVLDLGINTREYDGDAFLLTHETHVLEVVQTGGVDEGYLTHADDANLRSIAVAGHDVLEAVAGTKEVGTVDLVDFYMLGDGEVLQVATFHIGTVRSKMMVRKKVNKSTVTSLLGLRSMARNERQPLMP